MNQITLKNIIIRITVIALSCISGLNAYASSVLESSWPAHYKEINASIVRLSAHYETLTIEQTINLDPNIANIKTLSINLFHETFSTILERLNTKFYEFIESSKNNNNIVVNPYDFIILQNGFEKLNLLNQSFANLIKDPLTTDNDIILFMEKEYIFNLGIFFSLLHSFNKIMESYPKTL